MEEDVGKKDGKSQPSNVTHEKLKNLPFKTAGEMKSARDEIRKRVWQRFEHAKAIEEFSQTEDYDFFKKEFKSGLAMAFGPEDSVIRVYSDGPGLQIMVSESLKTDESTESLIGVLVKSTSEAFANYYYKAKGLIPSGGDEVTRELFEALLKKTQSKE